MQLSSPRTERLLAAIERGVGVFLLLSAGSCYGMWRTASDGHGEIAFLWLYATIAVPTGIGFYCAGLALHRSWRHRWLWQLGIVLALLVWAAWFKLMLLP